MSAGRTSLLKKAHLDSGFSLSLAWVVSFPRSQLYPAGAPFLDPARKMPLRGKLWPSRRRLKTTSGDDPTDAAHEQQMCPWKIP